MFTHFIGGGTDADTLAHWARVSDKTDGTLFTHLNKLIVGLKDDGIWDLIDIICVVHKSEADSLLNLKGTAEDADSVKVGSPNFTANRGFKMTDDNVVRFGETMSSLTKALNNSCHVWHYNRVHPTGTGSFLSSFSSGDQDGGDDYAKFLFDVNSWASFGESQFDVDGFDQSGNSIFKNNSTELKGFFGWDDRRTEGTIVWNDDFSTGNGGWGSPAESTTFMPIGALHDSGFSPDYEVETGMGACQYAGWGIGNHLGETGLRNLEDRIRTYMQDRGADVY